jgi:hypothetical protein
MKDIMKNEHIIIRKGKRELSDKTPELLGWQGILLVMGFIVNHL